MGDGDIFDELGFREDGGDLEHLAGALAVGGGDDGGLHVDEPVVLEEEVGGVGQAVLYSGHCGVYAGADSQMGDLAQVFVGEVVAAQRVFLVVALAQDLDVVRGRVLDAQLDLLALANGLNKSTLDPEAISLLGLLQVLPPSQLVVSNNLQWRRTRPINQLNKDEGILLRQPRRVGPASHQNLLTNILGVVPQNLINSEYLANEARRLTPLTQFLRHLEVEGLVHPLVDALDEFGQGEVNVDRDDVGDGLR